MEIDDGLTLRSDKASAQTIRDGGTYQGVRVSLVAELAYAEIAFHVDVNVGDPIWPGPTPITVPGLLGLPGVTLAPLARVLRGWDQSAQAAWVVWRRKHQTADPLPALFSELLANVAAWPAAFMTFRPKRSRYRPLAIARRRALRALAACAPTRSAGHRPAPT